MEWPVLYTLAVIPKVNRHFSKVVERLVICKLGMIERMRPRSVERPFHQRNSSGVNASRYPATARESHREPFDRLPEENGLPHMRCHKVMIETRREMIFMASFEVYLRLLPLQIPGKLCEFM
jgi:hypothetical protein